MFHCSLGRPAIPFVSIWSDAKRIQLILPTHVQIEAKLGSPIPFNMHEIDDSLLEVFVAN